MKVGKALRVTDWTEVVELGDAWDKEVITSMMMRRWMNLENPYGSNPKFQVASALVLTDNLDSTYSPLVPRGTSNRC